MNRVERLHAPLDHFGKLFGVVAMRIDAGISTISDFCARLKRVAEVFALEAADFLFLFDGFREHAGLCALLKDEIVVINIEIKVSSVLLGEGDAFVVDQARMLNGIDSGVDGVLDGLRAVSVSGHLAAEFVRFCGDGLELFERVLCLSSLSKETVSLLNY